MVVISYKRTSASILCISLVHCCSLSPSLNSRFTFVTVSLLFSVCLYSPNISSPLWATAGVLVNYEAVCLSSSNLSFFVPSSLLFFLHLRYSLSLLFVPKEVMFSCEAVPMFVIFSTTPFFLSIFLLSAVPSVPKQEVLSATKLSVSLSSPLQYSTMCLSSWAV